MDIQLSLPLASARTLLQIAVSGGVLSVFVPTNDDIILIVEDTEPKTLLICLLVSMAH